MLDKSISDEAAKADTAGVKRGTRLAFEIVAIFVLLAIGFLFVGIRLWVWMA